MAISRLTIIKFLELALTITCVALHFHSNRASTPYESFIITSTFGGYLIILIGVFVGIFTGQPASKRVDIFYTLAGCALFVTAGALTIQVYDHSYFASKEERDTGLAKASLAIINGAVFLLDSILSFRGEA